MGFWKNRNYFNKIIFYMGVSKIWLVLIFFFISGCNDTLRNDLDNKAFDTLLQTLHHDDIWVGVHTAEWLLNLGFNNDEIYEYYLNKIDNYGDTPQYRIGIWRVLAQSSTTEDQKNNWIEKIIRVYNDTTQIDRLHASESLAKLGVSLKNAGLSQSNRDLLSDDIPLRAYVTWGRSNFDHNDSINLEKLFSLVYSDDEAERRIGAYAITFLTSLPQNYWYEIADIAKNEPSGSTAKIHLLTAAFVTASDSLKNSSFLKEIKDDLLSVGMTPRKSDRYHLFNALAKGGTIEDILLLEEVMDGHIQLTADLPGLESISNGPETYDHPWNADLRSASAYAILRIQQTVEKSMSVFDWIVIMIYMLGMMSVGFYYSKKNITADDFHLGGRSMPSFLVGLSIFATLMSTISYLAYPGEIIQYGFIFFAGILAIPFVYYVAGWFLIPQFMKLNLTNAYEILEVKIGHGVRILGTFFFLSLRMLWMATIIHILVTIVFQSIFVIDPKYIPLLSILLAGITVLYTSFGGIRAVVLTDSIQTLIMFFGVILTIIIIGFSLQSVFDIIPSTYPAHWGDIDWSFDPQKRMTIGNVVLSWGLWFICTAGSDQMAIQRYMGTKDVRTARRSFGINLLTNMASKVLFALVGLALLAYFTQHPYKLPEGHSVVKDADSLFPRFLLIGLPIGITGLIVSALLAAAMSSLSSGLLSSTTIISGDLIEYFNNKVKPVKHKRFVKFIKNPRNTSLTIGVLITILSLFVGFVEGNVLAITMKVVNLFTAPLFVLFFMALFIPFATEKATVIAGLCSVAVAIAIAFFEIFGIQFLWIVPFALFTGIIVGTSLSAMEKYVFVRNK